MMAMMPERRNGLQEFADAAFKGVQAGQQYRSNEQQQQLTANQLAEQDRTQRMRTSLAAIAPEDYAGQAGVFQQYGDPTQAAAALERGRSAADRKRKLAAQNAFAAIEAGDLAAASKYTSELGLFGAPHEFAGQNKKGDLLFKVQQVDPKTNTLTPKTMKLGNEGYLRALVAATSGPEDAYKLGLEERKLMAIRGALGGGGGGKTSDYQLEAETDKGVPVYRMANQQYVPDPKTGRLIPYTSGGGYGTRLRYLGSAGKGGADQADPIRSAFVKNIERDPEVGYPMLQQYDMKQAALAKVAENRAKPPNVQAQELGQAAATLQNATPQARRQMLQQAVASGYDPAVAASIFDPRYAIPPAR